MYAQPQPNPQGQAYYVGAQPQPYYVGAPPPQQFYGQQPVVYGVPQTPSLPPPLPGVHAYGASPMAQYGAQQRPAVAQASYPAPVVVSVPVDGPPGYSGAYGSATTPNLAPASKYVAECEKAVRLGFVRKVYAILALQLLATFSMVAVFTFADPVRRFVQASPGLLISAIVLSFGFLIALTCCPGVARRHPTNLYCLAGFTLAEGYLVGCIASFSGSDAVLKAVACTVLLTLVLTAYAWQTKVDFTAAGGYLCAAVISLLLVGLMSAIFPSQIMSNIYAGLGCLVFSA